MFYSYVSEKRALYLYCICVLYLIVTLVISAHYVCTYCNVSDKRILCFVFEKWSLYLYFIATSVIRARSVLYLFFALLISAHYICTILLQ